MGTSGAETLATAGGIFVGLMETPLLVRPYLERMTRSEVFALMVAGLASISGGLLVAYVGMLSPFFPDIGGHLVSASFMSAPAALAVAKLLYPETEAAETSRSLPVESERSSDVNLRDAAGRGATEGMFLALKVGAMLVVSSRSSRWPTPPSGGSVHASASTTSRCRECWAWWCRR
jgi:CNT family concentrative nucleoside transporter